jgi:hypothetical protein
MLGGTSLTTTASPRIYYAIIIYLFMYLFIYRNVSNIFRYTAHGLTIVILEITEGFSTWRNLLKIRGVRPQFKKKYIYIYIYILTVLDFSALYKGRDVHFRNDPRSNLNFLNTPNRSHARSCWARLSLKPLVMMPAQFILPVRTFHAGKWMPICNNPCRVNHVFQSSSL